MKNEFEYLELHGSYRGSRHNLRMIETFDLEKRLEMEVDGKWREISDDDEWEISLADPIAGSFIRTQKERL